MKKKTIKVLGIILVFIIILFIVSKIHTMKQTKENAKKSIECLMDSISKGNYEQIKLYISKNDGTELTNEQISNFLLNTDLYRAIIGNYGIVSFNVDTSFFNPKEANIVFSYKTLSGEVITNELKYSHSNGLMTDKIKESNKTKERFPIATDLANGNTIGYNDFESDSEKEISTMILSYAKDDNDKVFIEVINECKEDIKVKILNNLYSELNSLKKINENYNIVWDNEYKEFSIYYNEQLHNSDSFFEHNYMKFNATILDIAITLQCIDGNEDWRLTINYYDYDNDNELLKTETIR